MKELIRNRECDFVREWVSGFALFFGKNSMISMIDDFNAAKHHQNNDDNHDFRGRPSVFIV